MQRDAVRTENGVGRIESYEDPALGLALRVPPPQVMLPFQVARGVPGVAALSPWLLLVTLAAARDWLALALTMERGTLERASLQGALEAKASRRTPASSSGPTTRR